jgi:hypothetical protein
MANVIRPPAWPADRFNEPSRLAKWEINSGDPGPRPLQRQLKRREIGPLFSITGTQNTTLKDTMHAADRLAQRWSARKVDT